MAALKEDRFDDFLAGITASGNSSWKWLQNCYTNANVQEQGICIALALTEMFIAEKKRGACRIHGGGFAGTAQAFVPLEMLEKFRAGIEAVLGTGSCHTVTVRPVGGIRLDRTV